MTTDLRGNTTDYNTDADLLQYIAVGAGVHVITCTVIFYSEGNRGRTASVVSKKPCF